MTTQYTPWAVSEKPSAGYWHIEDTTSRILAKVADNDTAQLMAAAPKLLEALIELVAVPNKNRPEEYWENARKAIAAAKGE